MARWKPPQAARRDANEDSVVEILELHGLTVERADQPVDLIVGYAGRTYLVEVKNGPKAPTTKLQDKFFARWSGHVEIICTDAEAIDFAARVRSGAA